jgi:hypothetical protein
MIMAGLLPTIMCGNRARPSKKDRVCAKQFIWDYSTDEDLMLADFLPRNI